jgi:cAMP phosphodiesterase
MTWPDLLLDGGEWRLLVVEADMVAMSPLTILINGEPVASSFGAETGRQRTSALCYIRSGDVITATAGSVYQSSMSKSD